VSSPWINPVITPNIPDEEIWEEEEDE